MKGGAVMFDYRRFALWIAVLLVPGGILLLPLLLADMRAKKNAAKAAKAANEVTGDDPKTPNDGRGPTPRTPHDGPTPRLAA
jgi:hypothetical protein